MPVAMNAAAGDSLTALPRTGQESQYEHFLQTFRDRQMFEILPKHLGLNKCLKFGQTFGPRARGATQTQQRQPSQPARASGHVSRRPGPPRSGSTASQTNHGNDKTQKREPWQQQNAETWAMARERRKKWAMATAKRKNMGPGHGKTQRHGNTQKRGPWQR